jgi:hypothetical protein
MVAPAYCGRSGKFNGLASSEESGRSLDEAKECPHVDKIGVITAQFLTH